MCDRRQSKMISCGSRHRFEANQKSFSALMRPKWTISIHFAFTRQHQSTQTHTRARALCLTFRDIWLLYALCIWHSPTHFIVFVFYLSLFHSIRFALFILSLHTSPLFTLLVPPSSHAVYSRFHFIFYSFFFFSFIHDDHSLVICCVQSVRCYVRRCMPIVRIFLMSA